MTKPRRLHIVGNPSDHPWNEIVRATQALIADGHWIQQKFSCKDCGNRLTMDVANVLYTHGHCDKCGNVTNIKAIGCNYRLMMKGRMPLEWLVDAGLVKAPPNPGLTIAETDPMRLHAQPAGVQ